MTRVFVSGCYDILHAGHVQFFREAKALGTHLTVTFAGSDVLWQHKQRRSSLPDDHKRALIAALDMVDDVIVTHGTEHGLDFRDDFLRLKPDILAVTEDDKYGELKRALCAQVGARYVVLPKTPPQFTPLDHSAHRSATAHRLRRRLARRPAPRSRQRLHRELRDLAHRLAPRLAL